MTFTQNQIGAKSSYGTIFMNTGNWTGVSFALTTSYQELTSLGTNFTLISPSPDFAMTTDGRLKYTGLSTRNFLATGIYSDGSSSSKAIAFYKNGVLITGSESYASDAQLNIVNIPVSLATNDYISMWIKISASASETIYQIAISIVSTI